MDMCSTRKKAIHVLFLVCCIAAALGRELPKSEKPSLENGQISAKECKSELEPPKADRRPHELEIHGDIRKDYYFWLRDDERKDPDVLSYLEAENNYTEAGIDKKSVELLFKEMKGRIQEEDQDAPLRYKNYFYYGRKLEGQEHGVLYRQKIPDNIGPPSIHDELDKEIPEEVIIDKEKEAKKHDHYLVSTPLISVDEKLAAYGEDVTGAERHDLHIKEIETGKHILSQPIPNTTGYYAWSADSTSIFYVTWNDQNRSDKVWRHDLNSTEPDTLIFEEPNPGIWIISIHLSRDDEVILLWSSAGFLTFDYQYLDAKNPKGELKPILGFQQDVKYIAEHRGGYFYMVILEGEKSNFKMVFAPLSDPTQQKVLISSGDGVKFISFILRKNFLATLVLKGGIYEVTVYSLPEGNKPPENLGEGFKIDFDEPAYKLELGPGGDFDSDILRLKYASMTTPQTDIDIDMRTGERAIKKVKPVLGGFDQTNYKTDRIWATAEDGVKIPMSIVYRQDSFSFDGSNPLEMRVYGAHEVVLDPAFSRRRLTLLDRGFVFVLAHVRGGGFFGREWYDAGRLLNKKTTFSDAISCAEHLIYNNYTSLGKLSISGGSSGGLAVGAIVNMRPDLFLAATLHVPLIDLLTTFLDESIGIVTVNWPEYGNPKEEEMYWYMKSYSPVDNVWKTNYPHMYVTAGLTDRRVGYWGPAKYVAKVRYLKTDSNKIFLKTDLSAGHGRKPGRFDALKDDARVTLSF